MRVAQASSVRAARRDRARHRRYRIPRLEMLLGSGLVGRAVLDAQVRRGLAVALPVVGVAEHGLGLRLRVIAAGGQLLREQLARAVADALVVTVVTAVA